jgi:DNA-3-methyladenine glycosylase II
MITGEVPATRPFSFAESLWFLDRGLDDCMHRVTGDVARKLIAVKGKPVLIEIGKGTDGIATSVLSGQVESAHPIVEYVAEWLDTGRDIRPFYKLLKTDTELACLADSFRGLHMVGIPDLFETLVWCVIGQQINLPFAYRVKRVLVEKYGSSIRHAGVDYHLFPSPDTLANVAVENFRELQLTTRKAEYIRNIATLFVAGRLSRQALAKHRDEEKMMHALMEVRGIGEWTANYALMKCMRAMNRLPVGDAGVNIALNRLKGFPKKNNRKEIEALFSRFEGWKTYLVYYLWRSLREKSAG